MSQEQEQPYSFVIHADGADFPFFTSEGYEVKFSTDLQAASVFQNTRLEMIFFGTFQIEYNYNPKRHN